MPYVIRRTDQGGGWVADPHTNRGASYTRALQRAKVFQTYEAADGDRCPGNEVYRWTGKWRERYAWAAAYPLVEKAPKVKKANTLDVKLAKATKLYKLAQTRAKRAQTILKKHRRTVAYYEARQAATRAS